MFLKSVCLADLVHVLHEVVVEKIRDVQQKLRIDGVSVEEVVEVGAFLAATAPRERAAQYAFRQSPCATFRFRSTTEHPILARNEPALDGAG